MEKLHLCLQGYLFILLEMNKKVRTARLSIFSNSFLIILKVIVGVISGSISILSEAIHSLIDLIAAGIAFFSVRISDTPADDRHPYGHGKFENISGVAEAGLIFLAAIWIIYEAVKKILHPNAVEVIGLGIGVMIVSALVNIFISRKLYKVAKETESIALEADALHLKVDVYTSFGVASGLLLMVILELFTKNPLVHYLDPVIAILVALMIVKESFTLFMKAYAPLLDESLSKEEIKTLKELIERHCSETVNYHDLRTRKAGNFKYVDFHLNLPPNLSVKEAHEICDAIEEEIKQFMTYTEVNIHVENF
jgi:cation diffusion facilitator family transporter